MSSSSSSSSSKSKAVQPLVVPPAPSSGPQALQEVPLFAFSRDIDDTNNNHCSSCRRRFETQCVKLAHSRLITVDPPPYRGMIRFREFCKDCLKDQTRMGYVKLSDGLATGSIQGCLEDPVWLKRAKDNTLWIDWKSDKIIDKTNTAYYDAICKTNNTVWLRWTTATRDLEVLTKHLKTTPEVLLHLKEFKTGVHNWRDFEVGDVVDVLHDNHGNKEWREATVRQVKMGRIYVRFAGCSSFCDAWIDMDCKKFLAPQGTHTGAKETKETDSIVVHEAFEDVVHLTISNATYTKFKLVSIKHLREWNAAHGDPLPPFRFKFTLPGPLDSNYIDEETLRSISKEEPANVMDRYAQLTAFTSNTDETKAARQEDYEKRTRDLQVPCACSHTKGMHKWTQWACLDESCECDDFKMPVLGPSAKEKRKHEEPEAPNKRVAKNKEKKSGKGKK